MTVVQETRKLLALHVVSLHRRLEQRLLDVTRHVAPDVHRCPSEQVCESVLFIGHFRSLTALVLVRTAVGSQRSIALIGKGPQSGFSTWST